MLKRALVLSGGGFVGAGQWGVLRKMKQLNIPIDVVFGVSVGNLNGAFVAMDRYDLLDDLWNSVITTGPSIIYDSKYLKVEGSKLDVNINEVIKDIAPKINFDTVWKLLSKRGRETLVKQVLENALGIQSLASNQPLQDLLTKHVAQDKFVLPFYMGLVSLTTGDYSLLNTTDYPDNKNLVKGITASATMPIIWQSIDEILTKYGIITKAVDGGVRRISPLGDAVDYIQNVMGDNPVEWEIIIVNCNNGKVDPITGELNLFTIANRSLNEIALSEILLRDIKEFIKLNNLVVQSPTELLSSNGKPYKSFKYRIIQPEDSSLSGVLDSSPEMLLKRKEWGEYQALKTFPDFR